jgi:hypothetical protein
MVKFSVNRLAGEPGGGFRLIPVLSFRDEDERSPSGDVGQDSSMGRLLPAMRIKPSSVVSAAQ